MPDASAIGEPAESSQPGQPSDRVLLAAEAAAARWAFTVVMRRHSGVLYSVAYRRVESVRDAEELVQDAFVLLWRKRNALHLVGDSALPWLVVTVQHLAANRRRAMQRRGRHEFVGIDRDDADPRAEIGIADDAIERAFASLAPTDAAVARLCLVEELTYAEAATRLGLTEGAVRNRLSRARVRLRRVLGAEREDAS